MLGSFLFCLLEIPLIAIFFFYLFIPSSTLTKGMRMGQVSLAVSSVLAILLGSLGFASSRKHWDLGTAIATGQLSLLLLRLKKV
ncbi:hypothetical protein BDV95DRAFT_384889 [Massariosphaeria phaeospora]|uniref:Uncharacterized protein n=1 Tax=Massariosphaeria phaeospora TaxID=100035 RepID=A0A7C8MG46_9PLEO|nr:hypothetical protein BDV95DRAFT_384889 [Massariosphaeria phaeospora]